MFSSARHEFAAARILYRQFLFRIVELESLRVPKLAAPELARAQVKHFSQWIDAWCVDWEHAPSGPMNVTSYVHRRSSGEPLELEVGHTYAKPGSYVALVKAFDVLGGQTTKSIDLTIA